MRKKFDLRSASQWREHVEQTRAKVSTIIANKIQVRFDWFDVPEEMTIADVCRKKAVNLVGRCALTEYSTENCLGLRFSPMVMRSIEFSMANKKSSRLSDRSFSFTNKRVKSPWIKLFAKVRIVVFRKHVLHERI